MAETVKKFDVHVDQITEWKKQLLDGAADVFGKGRSACDKYPTYARPLDAGAIRYSIV